MMRRLRRAIASLMLAGGLQACAEWRAIPPATSQEAACARFFGQMDETVAGRGVADAGAARVEGFPFLRVNRFLASFADPELRGAAYLFWLERLRQLDETARLLEWRNLPPDAAARLQAYAPSGLSGREAVAVCGRLLAGQYPLSTAGRSRLLAQATVPDAYSDWLRALGLYALTRWGIVEGVYRLHREQRSPFIFPHPDLPAEGHLLRYAPPAATPRLEASKADEILSQAAANPLGIPEPSADTLDQLFAMFAPVWEIDTRSDADRIGSARLGQDGKAYIDLAQPAVYRQVSYARLGQQVLLQLNYLIWFPARPPAGALDIYAGRFDGLIWRVSLSADGTPLAYDSIHPCGCYYQIFPAAGWRAVQPQDGSEPIVAPTAIPRLKPGEQLVVRLSARTHFIQAVAVEKDTQAHSLYAWLDYDGLRSLPLADGRRRSLFGPDGLVAGSERPERFLFWPMGIASAGAMRQSGNHAIAFLGRRHFDDPRLLESILRPVQE